MLRSQIKTGAPNLTISTASADLTISLTPGDFKSDALHGHKLNGRRTIFAELIFQRAFKGSDGRPPMSGRSLCDL